MVEEVGEERRQRVRGRLAARAEERPGDARHGLVGQRAPVRPRRAQRGEQIAARVGAPTGDVREQEGVELGVVAAEVVEARAAPGVHARGVLVRQPERRDGRRGGQPVAELGDEVGLLAVGEAAGEDVRGPFDAGGQRGQGVSAERW